MSGGAWFITALCVIGVDTGDYQCFDTGFESPDYQDCTDRPDPPIGSTSERGGGRIVIGWRDPQGILHETGAWTYDWSGRADQGGGRVRALIGVDGDVIHRDGLDRTCVDGAFNP